MKYKIVRLVTSLILGFTLAITQMSSAHAAGFVVDSTSDAVDINPGDGICETSTGSCTLRAAIMESNILPGDDIITLPTGTYNLTLIGANEDATVTGDLDITNNLIINGAGAESTIIDGNGGVDYDRVIHITGAFTVSITGATIMGGTLGGIFSANGSELILTDSAVRDNTTPDNGGGIRMDGSSKLTLSNSVIDGNSAMEGSGGGIFSTGTDTLINSTISNNIALGGGGIYIFPGSSVTLTNSIVSANQALIGYGGGISNSLDSTLTLTATTVSGNSAGYQGGGIANERGATASLTDCTVSNNSATYGGGIGNLGNISITNSNIIGNSGYTGGGIYNSYGNVFVNNSTIGKNTTSVSGSGISNKGTIEINESTIINNRATNNGVSGAGISNEGEAIVTNSSIVGNRSTNIGAGINNWGQLTLTDSTVNKNSPGGIVNVDTLELRGSTISNNAGSSGIINSGVLNVTDSTFSGNSSPDIGGGITNGNDGTLSINKSTFSNNHAGIFGGGIANLGPTLDITNSTFSNNSAQSGAGIGNASDSEVTIVNSTFAENSADYGSSVWNDIGSTTSIHNTILAHDSLGNNCSGGGFIDGGGNLSWPDISCPGINTNPLLGSLANNLGPTETHALLSGSPAINMALEENCPSTDQRGVARQGVACDIGAFEYELATIEVSIDIKPGSDTNPINPNSNGNIPVAILSTTDFDAPSMVDVSSLTFGRTGNEKSLAFCNQNGEDVNGDGLLDQVCHFETQLTGLVNPKIRYGNLKGYTVDGTPLKGKDIVTILY